MGTEGNQKSKSKMQKDKVGVSIKKTGCRFVSFFHFDF
jgi:hypothetical protein